MEENNKRLPRGRQSSTDRAPTIDEIRKLLDYPDRRIKPIIFTMISSGIRLGAWDLLQWGNVEPVLNENGSIDAAKLLVYAGDVEEYYAFITPEAYDSLKDWIDFRQPYGEKITTKSWLMRDLWQTTNMNYGARWGLATNPKRLKSSGIKRLLKRAIWEEGIRQSLKKGTKRHEWKAAHGFRKFYKTRAEQVMKPINVEITMGHDIGVSASYYKPTQNEVLEDYLKAISLLTIDNGNVLQNQIKELNEKSKGNDNLIKTVGVNDGTPQIWFIPDEERYDNNVKKDYLITADNPETFDRLVRIQVNIDRRLRNHRNHLKRLFAP